MTPLENAKEMAARRALPSESNRTHEGPIDACVSCPPLRKGGFGKRTGGIAHLKRDWRHLPSNAFGRKARVGTWTRGFARANRESRRPVGVAGRRCPGPRPPAKAFGRATARTAVQLNAPSPNRNAALRRRISAKRFGQRRELNWHIDSCASAQPRLHSPRPNRGGGCDTIRSPV